MLQHGGISRTLCYMKYVTKGHTVYDSTYMRYLLLFFKSLSHVQLFPTPCTAACQPPWPSKSPRVCPISCSLHQWCHPAISSSDALFSFCPQYFPASGTLPMSQMFTSDDQNTEVSASASVLPMNIQDWFPLGLTGLISLLSKGLSGVFFNPTVQKHQFFSTQFSLQSNSYIHTWLLEKP